MSVDSITFENDDADHDDCDSDEEYDGGEEPALGLDTDEGH